MDGLTPQKRVAIAELVLSGNVIRAAKKCGAAVRTVYKWLEQDNELSAAVQAGQDETIKQSAAMLLRIQGKAIRKLEKLIGSKSESIARLACVSVLDFGFKMNELSALQDRIAKLEEDYLR